jgi:hypothetical protein
VNQLGVTVYVIASRICNAAGRSLGMAVFPFANLLYDSTCALGMLPIYHSDAFIAHS